MAHDSQLATVNEGLLEHEKVLIVGPAWVGDMVMTHAVVQKLLEFDATVHILAPLATAAVAERMPGVETVHRIHVNHGQIRLAERLSVARSLRRHEFGRAIVLPNSFKAALVPWIARIPLRTGWRGEWRYGLLNDLRRLEVSAYPLMIERFLALTGGRNGRLFRPRLEVDNSKLQALRRKFGLGKAKPVVALCPGAAFGPAKRWPPEHFAYVAEKVVSEGAEVWLFGTEGDNQVCDSIVRAVTEVKNLAGRTDLGEAIDLLSVVDWVVANDSGLMHVAAALGRRVVALFGPTSPEFTPPLSDDAVMLQHSIECSPCFERTCPLGHMKCLVDLAPERVIRAMKCMSF